MDLANPEGASVGSAAKRLSDLLKPEPTPTGGEPDPKTDDKKPDPETPLKRDPDEKVELFKVKVSGEEKEVTLADLQKGYMMESDYRKKTTDVSERSKALEAKAAEIDAQLSEAQSLLELDLNNLESPEMLELKEADPEEYLKQFDKVQKRVNSFNKLKEKRLKEQSEKHAKQAEAELEALERAIPEWLDKDVRAKEANGVFKALETVGFKPEELKGLSDHRMFVVARKAMMYDQMMSKDLDSKVVRTPPKTQLPGTGQEKDDKQSTQIKQLRAKLQKSGSVNDAAALLSSR